MELLLDLDERLHAYMDADPIRLERQVQPDGQTFAVVLRVTRPPPVELGLLVGEVAHQLRSALDHVANGLVAAAGNAPTSRTAFPVLDVRPPLGLRIHGGVSPEALAAVDALQPYQRSDPHSHPLHVLTTLWNIDKHRRLHLTVLQAAGTQAFVGPPDGTPLVGGQFRAGPVGDGEVFAAFRMTDLRTDTELELTATGSSFIGLGEPGPWPSDLPVQLLLERLHEYVALVALPRLEPHLLGPRG